MTPLESIKQGILEKDWFLVCEGYSSMTGELLEIPDDDGVSVNTLKSIIIDCFESYFGRDTNFDQKEQATHPRTNQEIDQQPHQNNNVNDQLPDDSDTSIKEFDEKIIHTDKTGYYGNKTVLIGDEPSQDRIEAVKKWKEMDAKRTKIRRPKYEKYKIQCSVCEKEFESVIPPDKKIGQKCSRCMASRKPS